MLKLQITNIHGVTSQKSVIFAHYRVQKSETLGRLLIQTSLVNTSPPPPTQILKDAFQCYPPIYFLCGSFHVARIIQAIQCWVLEWFINHWKEVVVARLRSYPAEIRPKHLPNTSLECYCYANPLVIFRLVTIRAALVRARVPT